MRVRLVALTAGLTLVLAMVGMAAAHPRVPPQSVCVLPYAAADGIHTAAFGPAGDTLAGHVLYVKSPHYCD